MMLLQVPQNSECCVPAGGGEGGDTEYRPPRVAVLLAGMVSLISEDTLTVLVCQPEASGFTLVRKVNV